MVVGELAPPDKEGRKVSTGTAWQGWRVKWDGRGLWHRTARRERWGRGKRVMAWPRGLGWHVRTEGEVGVRPIR